MKYLTSEGDINNIHVSEEMADGSFQFNQGVDNISATLNLVVRGATNPAMANIATLNYLRQNYWHPEAGIAYQGIPLNNISITSTGSCLPTKRLAHLISVVDNGLKRIGTEQERLLRILLLTTLPLKCRRLNREIVLSRLPEAVRG